MDLSNAYALSALVDKHEKYLKDYDRIASFIGELSKGEQDNKFVISIDGGMGCSIANLVLNISEDREALEALMSFCSKKMNYYSRGIESFVATPFSNYRSKDDVILS